MKFVLISDTHSRHNEIKIPEGDVLIHSGDFTVGGSLYEIDSFATWIEKQPCRYKIVVAGNHDLKFQDRPLEARKVLSAAAPSVIYLEDTDVILGGLKIWGSPWVPKFYDWAFMYPRNSSIADEHWKKIPADVNILVTHGPSFGKLDLTRGGVHAGCEDLARHIPRLKHLQMHVFGHIHPAYGIIDRLGVIYANAAICDDAYKAVKKPLEVKIDKISGGVF